MKNYVIIGNSTAAVNCVEAIRSVDREGEIAIVSDEPHFTYGRPLISYLLYGKTDAKKMNYRPDDWYEKNKVTTYLGVRAEKIDAKEKQVLLSDGKTLAYDQLLVATGSRPFVPPMEGLDGVKDQYTFMTKSDALRMEKEFTKEDDVLVIGAGLIGLKCVEGIFDRVRSVTVVDMANRILPSILDEEGSETMQRFLEEKGVRFFLSDSAAKFENNTAVLKSGNVVPFDRLVIAVGVRPNTELVKEAGGAVERGVVVDETCQTTLPDVYAAGDCTLSYDVTIGAPRILALLPNAAFQGRCAGKNMAGVKEVFDNAIPMNAMGMFGKHIMTAGCYEGESYVEKDGENYKKLFWSDGVLKGFILIGKVEKAGIYTSLIRNRTPLSQIDFESVKKDPSLAAFSSEYRKEKFTREV